MDEWNDDRRSVEDLQAYRAGVREMTPASWAILVVVSALIGSLIAWFS